MVTPEAVTQRYNVKIWKKIWKIQKKATTIEFFFYVNLQAQIYFKKDGITVYSLLASRISSKQLFCSTTKIAYFE